MQDVNLCGPQGKDVTANWQKEFSLIHHTITMIETTTIKF